MELAAADLVERGGDQDFNDADSDVEDDDQFFVDEDFSSPSSEEQLIFNNNPMYAAYRGGNLYDNVPIVGGGNDEIPQQQPEQQQQQVQNNDEEEADFLEMDFEPENSEIEIMNGHNQNGNHENHDEIAQHNQALENFNQSLPSHFNQISSHNQQQHQPNNNNNNLPDDFPALHHHRVVDENHYKNTGARPKILKQQQPLSDARCQKSNKQKHVMEGDQVFKITGHFSTTDDRFCEAQDQSLGCSFSNYRHEFSSSSAYRNGHTSSFNKHHHKSPIKSCHKRGEEENSFEREQNDKFLFEIEPIKMRKSATVYTTNCDEKILLDALTSLKLNPNREIISNYFNSKSKLSPPDLGFVDFIIYRSKLNCNYLKLIELIQKSCEEENVEFGCGKFEINFYPLDFFSTTPEMIDIEISEIIKRWTPQTDLTPLACIKNKYFYQTNVLGKIVNIIRRMNGNHKPDAIVFDDNETLKIPQFYVSGYITITTLRNQIQT